MVGMLLAARHWRKTKATRNVTHCQRQRDCVTCGTEVMAWNEVRSYETVLLEDDMVLSDCKALVC